MPIQLHLNKHDHRFLDRPVRSVAVSTGAAELKIGQLGVRVDAGESYEAGDSPVTIHSIDGARATITFADEAA